MAMPSWLLILAILWPLVLADVDEKQILLEFKQGLNDTGKTLKNWDQLSDHCKWTGITCSNISSVLIIDFKNFNLNGTISPVICKLPNLHTIRFAFNNFEQLFPPKLDSCSKLKSLDLSQNYLFGPLPSNIPTSLRELDLSENNFNGTIPKTFANLSLNVLILSANYLNGPLPPELGSLPNLTHLDVRFNPLSSSIPPELGRLSQLNYLALDNCELIGNIPPQFGNLKELRYLGLQSNNLSGSIPVELMFLPKLTQLELYVNNLSGEIPHEIGGLVSLEELDASQNFLNGSIPGEMSLLKNLRLIQLYHNRLTGELPSSLADLPLETVSLYSNGFTGTIPRDYGRRSSLSLFDVSKNQLTGSLPPYLCNGGSLRNLSLFGNMLSGDIPQSYGACKTLIRFQVHGNNLGGHVPEDLWTVPNMTVFNVRSNHLNGTLPSSMKFASSKLQNLFLDDNNFDGPLPVELGNLPTLVKFSAAGNRFTGSLPFGRCTSLENMNFSGNLLSGVLSNEVGNCLKLTSLDLSRNRISGRVPAALGILPNLNALDLSDNQLSGNIPPSLGNLPLSSLDLSYNDLQGSLPQSWTTSFSASSFVGNPGYCKWMKTACLGPATLKKSHQPVTWIVVLVVTTSLVMVALGLLYIYKRHCRLVTSDSHWKVKSFHKLTFDEMDVLEKMDRQNVIGQGQSGEVYKVDMWDGKSSVAVKQLWKSHAMNQREFQAEIGTLGNIRHRNIVKLLACCTSLESDLLILEYMPNGSLGDVLHRKGGENLSWKTRLRISLGAAQGLSYLHHDCSPPILHRDIKSNNILLDMDYEAKLADFGLARIFEIGNYNTMSDVAGSYGYIAPEYAYTLKVNEKSDMYSFGVVLLELATGRKPIEEEFGDGVDIVKWARSKMHTKGGPRQLLDTRLQKESEFGSGSEWVTLLKLALLCTSALPTKRPSARQVVEVLKKIQPRDYEDKTQD